MAKSSLAHQAHHVPPLPESDLEQISSVALRVLERIERGRELYRQHAEDFVYERGTWFLTSDTVPGRVYEVDVARETCECSDFHIRNVACKHLMAAAIAHAKSSLCSCCGRRVLNQFLDEATEDDELLGWFVGDLLCPDCVEAGYWA